jgi:hypothetical protein
MTFNIVQQKMEKKISQRHRIVTIAKEDRKNKGQKN